MYKVKKFIKRLFTPVTIMLIPHDDKKAIRLKLPSIGLIASVIAWMVGTVYIVSFAIDGIEYHAMKSKLGFYAQQFSELKSTISSLNRAEAELKRLLSVGSKEKILDQAEPPIHTNDAGSLDIDLLKSQILETSLRVDAIKEYLKEQKDLHRATPKGWPVEGRLSSPFGKRENPVYGDREVHSGVDISASTGSKVRATADGVVSFSGWGSGNGNLVVIEHGRGFSTLYAHNRANLVKIGQKVKRGEAIAYVGSTGNATGPHVHYEVWRESKPVNPSQFLKEGDNVVQKGR